MLFMQRSRLRRRLCTRCLTRLTLRSRDNRTSYLALENISKEIDKKYILSFLLIETNFILHKYKCLISLWSTTSFNNQFSRYCSWFSHKNCNHACNTWECSSLGMLLMLVLSVICMQFGGYDEIVFISLVHSLKLWVVNL